LSKISAYKPEKREADDIAVPAGRRDEMKKQRAEADLQNVVTERKGGSGGGSGFCRNASFFGKSSRACFGDARAVK